MRALASRASEASSKIATLVNQIEVDTQETDQHIQQSHQTCTKLANDVIEGVSEIQQVIDLFSHMEDASDSVIDSLNALGHEIKNRKS